MDDIRIPHLSDWQQVMQEADTDGNKGIVLGSYGYIPFDAEQMLLQLEALGLCITAGTIFNDLVAPSNLPSLFRQTREICAMIKQLPALSIEQWQRFSTP